MIVTFQWTLEDDRWAEFDVEVHANVYWADPSVGMGPSVEIESVKRLPCCDRRTDTNHLCLCNRELVDTLTDAQVRTLAEMAYDQADGDGERDMDIENDIRRERATFGE